MVLLISLLGLFPFELQNGLLRIEMELGLRRFRLGYY